MAAIELRGVVKRFGPITAVDGLDLDVPEGICLGLLGPNGAGKSTTMRLLTGQALPDAGELRALGHELPGDAKAARAEMGVVPQLDNLDVDVTVEDNLAVFARLYRVPTSAPRSTGRSTWRACATAPRRRRRALRRHAPPPAARPRARPRPRLILLDEPTVGLDPQIRTELWTLIDDLRSRGTTILMSTHYIEEAERLADEVAVMAHGQGHRRGQPAELIAEHAAARPPRSTAARPPGRVRADAEAAGLAVRPAGPAIAIVGSERANGGPCPRTRCGVPPRSRTCSSC
jgi:lipooligosaccharide transport system ATP-binding protein